MELERGKCTCMECGWRGAQDDLLIGPHPFVDGDDISGCPKCMAVDRFSTICDEPGCQEIVCSWWRSTDGNRATCHEHAEKED